jgi:hypothetical protein
MDRNRARKEIEDGALELGTIIEENGLYDGFRCVHPGARTFTFFQPDTGHRSRIDRIYVKENLFFKCLDWNIVHFPLFDHKLVSVFVRTKVKVRMGKGHWRLNPRLLANLAGQKSVQEALDALFKRDDATVQVNGQTVQEDWKAFKESVKSTYEVIGRQRGHKL